ncbi:MAG TPA: tRNA pseudouridine(55) synthase TruB [Steroidobacteraceae bacterium]
MPDGILLLDKPLGLSSNQALQRVRRLLGGAKAGHTGSLDPLASGMLPICIGEATKLAGELLAGTKCYRFGIALGERTESGDAEGQVIERLPVPLLERASIAKVLAELCGTQWQVPPMYSALKRAGQPLYRLARQGLSVERAARQVEIFELELLSAPPDPLLIRVRCSKGTYVRTLAEQIAGKLGTCGYVNLLRRESVQPFEREPMQTLDELERGGALVLLSADRAVPHLPALHLTALDTLALQRGQQAVSAAGLAPGRVRLYDPAGRFFGLGEVLEGGRVRVRRLFNLSPPSSGSGVA